MMLVSIHEPPLALKWAIPMKCARKDEIIIGG